MITLFKNPFGDKIPYEITTPGDEEPKYVYKYGQTKVYKYYSSKGTRGGRRFESYIYTRKGYVYTERGGVNEELIKCVEKRFSPTCAILKFSYLKCIELIDKLDYKELP